MKPWSGNYRQFEHRLKDHVLERDGVCQICRVREAVEVDHIVPVSQMLEAGLDPNTVENAQGLCRGCHARKTKLEQKRGLNRWKKPKESHPGLVR